MKRNGLERTALMRFNRYMVECESYSKRNDRAADEVLIDTWWNVNTERRSMYPRMFASFNRYMVECE